MAASESAASKKTSARGRAKVAKVKYRRGQLESAGRAKVKNRKQVVSIALNEASQSGVTVAPSKRAASTNKMASSKKTAAKKSAAKKKS
jgi:hypothetical protein